MIKPCNYILIFLLALSLPRVGAAQAGRGLLPDLSAAVCCDTAVVKPLVMQDLRHPVGSSDDGKVPLFLSGKFAGGQVLRTNDFVAKDYAIDFYWSAALKFGVSSVGNRWQDIAYGMPYYGIALEIVDYGRKKDLGRPVGIYLLQGATIANLTRRLDLKYEWNLGVSTGWKGYDPFDNPYNVAIGSETNVHVGYNAYLNWYAGLGTDIWFGVGLSHNSNGATKLPNAGMNNIMLFIEAAYNFNRQTVRKEYDPSLVPPPYDKHTASELSFLITSRQVPIDTLGTNMPSHYIDKRFKVFGLNYAFMVAPHYRYRYGLSLDLLYDESSGVTAKRERNPVDGKYYDRIYLGKVRDRFSMGFSARGEIVLPGYTIFANLGVQAVHGNRLDSRWYQVVGVKIYLKENFFGTFGIRTSKFSQASYLFWSLGYTIEHYGRGKRVWPGK